MNGTGKQAPGDKFRAQYPEAIAATLRKEFPGYAVTVRRDNGPPRYQLISRDGGNPVCLISPDAQEIWDELKGA
jgi:hypothetical protein